jgi:hypothetical protein
MRRAIARWAGPLLAAGVGLGWFVHVAGPQALNPVNHGWVLTGEDWSIHALGWWFFRNEPWALPLGRLDGLMYPAGTTVGFTDSIPLVAVLLKPLSPLLPERFHYIGLWLGFCFAANAAAGAWVARRLGAGLLGQVGAGALMATAPVLLPRMGHEALCAHFLLIVLVGLHLEPARPWPLARRSLLIAVGVVAMAGGIHPYLAAMTLPLAVALPLRNALVDRAAPLGTALWGPLAMVGALVATLLLFGYLGGTAPAARAGFGFWNADLLSLVNSRGFSRLLPEFPAGRPHLEGFGYLGLGTLGAVVASLVLGAVRWRDARQARWLRYLPLAVIALGALAFAVASEVKAGSVTLVNIDGVVAPFERLTGAFRGNGRFVWVPHYTVALAGTAGLLWGLRRRPLVAGVLLLALGVLQAADTRVSARGLFERKAMDVGLRSGLWSQLGEDYRHLALVPPQIADVGAPCGGELPGHFRYPFGYLAYRQRMTFNSASPARKDEARLKHSCVALLAALGWGQLDPQTVYVARGAAGERMRRSAGAVCGRVDAFDVCVSAGRPTPLRESLRQQRP